MDYATLVASKVVPGSIANWINRDTTDGPTILTEAQAYIYTRLKHWRMKAEVEDFMIYGQAFIDVPDDFIDAREFRITGNYNKRLKRGDERPIQAHYNYDVNGSRVLETPGWYYITAGGLSFDAVPDHEYPYLLTYYQVPEDLSVGNPTNWVTRFYPRLLRSACMLLAVEFEKEAGQGSFDRTYWMNIFMAEKNEIQGLSDIVERASDAPVEFA
jgi:hypothetical protein